HQRHTVGGNGLTHGRMEGVTGPESEANEGGASRFFYTAKAPKSERPNVDGVQHPTVKPLKIMQWLIRLVTPPVVLCLTRSPDQAPPSKPHSSKASTRSASKWKPTTCR